MDNFGVGVASLKAFLAEHPEHKVYDFSSLELADQCFRKYRYKYVDKIGDQPGIEAEFSKCLIHPTIARSYEHPYDVYHNMRAERKFWDPYWKAFQNSGAHPTTAKQEHIYKLEIAQRLVTVFCNNYSGEFDLYQLLGTEVLYWRELPGLKHAVWVAKPDLMLKRKGDGIVVSGEIKVSTWDFNRNLNSMDRQLLSQAWSTGAKQQMKIFLQIVCERDQFADIRVTKEMKPPDGPLLVEWLDETQFSVGVLQDAMKSDIWPKRAPRACFDFNRPCQFHDICPMSLGQDMILKSLPHGNPLEYLGL